MHMLFGWAGGSVTVTMMIVWWNKVYVVDLTIICCKWKGGRVSHMCALPIVHKLMPMACRHFGSSFGAGQECTVAPSGKIFLFLAVSGSLPFQLQIAFNSVDSLAVLLSFGIFSRSQFHFLLNHGAIR